MTTLGTMLQGAALALRDRGPYALMEESHRVIEAGTEWIAGPSLRYEPTPEDFDDWTEEARAAWYEDANQYPSPDLFVVTALRRHANGRKMMVQTAYAPTLIFSANFSFEEFIRRDAERMFTRCAEAA